MKKNIHPDYRPVVVCDTSCGFQFLTRSTVKTNETIKWTDGVEYPLVKVEISSASHPFYTGKKSSFSKLGKVEEFKRRYANFGGNK